jgi:hypothetical protein
VYVLFAAPLPWRELRDVVRALALRFPAIDTAPMSSLGGQISPPGSRHRSGGWRLLSMSLAVVGQPSGPEAWAVLLTELAAELREVQHERGQLLAAGISEQPDQPRRKVTNDKHHASSLPATVQPFRHSQVPGRAVARVVP